MILLKANSVLQAALVGLAVGSIIGAWKGTEAMKKWVLKKLTGKEDLESVDLEFLVRVLIFIVTMTIIVTSIIYIANLLGIK